jgi:serine/threonine protein kinase
LTSVAQAGRRFQFLQEIASGGFGCVYLAKLIQPDGDAQVVAVKLLHRRWSDNVEISSRMRDEARLLSRLRHEHIVEVLDFALIDGRSAVVMEYLDAIDARIIIDHCRESGVRLPLAAALELCAAVASALDAAYNDVPAPGSHDPGSNSERPLRVIHRDIKPSNLMVDARGGVKVLDFGIARAEFDAREAKTAELAFGSLEYMPPERLFFEPESAASDVYSLGTALYELLALDKLGKAKLRQSEQERFLGERLADLTERYVLSDVSTPGVEADLVDLLKSMLAFDESNRPTAANVSSRMRELAARGASPTLAEWAAKVVPKLIEEARTSKQGSGTLVGQTVTEDPPSPFRGRPRDSDDDGTNDTDIISLEDVGDVPTARDDTRWLELKRIALESLSETSEVGPAVVQELRLQTLPPERGFIEPVGISVMGTPGSAPVRHPMAATEKRPGRAPASAAPPSEVATDFVVLDSAPSSSSTDRDSVGRTEATTLRLPRSFPTPRPPNEGEPEPPAPPSTPESAPPPPVRVEREAAQPTAGAPSQPGRDNRPRSLLGEDDLEGAPTVRFQADEAPGERNFSLWNQPNSQPDSQSDSQTVPSEVETIVVPGFSGGRTPSVSPRRAAHRSTLPPTPAPIDDGTSAPLAYAISAVLLLVTMALVLLTVLFVGAIGVAALSLPAAPLPPVSRPAEPEEIVGSAPPASGTGALFVSALQGTRRMMVRCGDATGVGSDRVLVPGDRFAECTITAVDAGRKRRTAVLKLVEPRPYRCFEGNESTCQ